VCMSTLLCSRCLFNAMEREWNGKTYFVRQFQIKWVTIIVGGHRKRSLCCGLGFQNFELGVSAPQLSYIQIRIHLLVLLLVPLKVRNLLVGHLHCKNSTLLSNIGGDRLILSLISCHDHAGKWDSRVGLSPCVTETCSDICLIDTVSWFCFVVFVERFPDGDVMVQRRDSTFQSFRATYQ
jgi:hypothetical protein